MNISCQFCNQVVERYNQCIRPPPHVFCGYECKENYREQYGEYKRTIGWGVAQENPEKELMNTVLRQMQESFKCFVCDGGILCCKFWVFEAYDVTRDFGDYHPACSENCYKKYYGMEEEEYILK
jgi:hypothetical protein